MKRILLPALLLAFGFSAMAQDAATSSAGHPSTTKTAKTKKSTSSDTASPAGDASASASKSSHLTGCVSSSANSEGNYTLTNGKYKKGVELIPADGTDVSKHAGHEVQLTGNWTTEAAEKASKSTDTEKYGKHFQVASIKHMADTCPASASAKSGGSKDIDASASTHPATTKGKNKKAGNAMATPGSDTTNPK